jgi:tetratricopeptide (TPR) repeat protein
MDILRLYVADDLEQQRAVQRARHELHDIGDFGSDLQRQLDAIEPKIVATGLAGPRGELALARAQARLESDESVLRALATQAERDGDDYLAARVWLDLATLVITLSPDAARAKDLLSIADAAVRRLGEPSDLRAEWIARDALAAALDGDTDHVRGAAQRIAALAPPGTAVYSTVAAALRQINDPAGAAAILEPLVARQLRSDPVALSALGEAYLELGRSRDARTTLTNAVTVAAAGYPDHVMTAVIRVHLAHAYVDLGETQQALAELERARPIVTAAGAPAAATATYHEHHAQVLSELGRHDEAARAMRAAIAAYTSTPHHDAKYVSTARLNLAVTLGEAGDDRAAVDVATAALAELEASGNVTTVYGANGYSTLGTSLRRLGRTGPARTAFEKALQIYAKIEIDPAFVGFAKVGLARVLPGRERRRARALATEALDAWRKQPAVWAGAIEEAEAWLAQPR